MCKRESFLAKVATKKENTDIVYKYTKKIIKKTLFKLKMLHLKKWEI